MDKEATAKKDLDVREVHALLFWKWVSFGTELILLPLLAPTLPGQAALPIFIGVWLAHALPYTYFLRRHPEGFDGRRLLYPSFLLDIGLVTVIVLALGEWRTPYTYMFPAHVLSAVIVRPYPKDIVAVALAGFGAFFAAHLAGGEQGMPYWDADHWSRFLFAGMLVVPPLFRLRLLLDRVETTLGAKREAESLASRLETRNRELQALSVTDSLTGVYNKRHFDTRLAEEINRGGAAGRPVALMMLDIDFFKAYNDTHGHPRGDVVLREVARLIREKCRTGDVVCRYGGEELAVILPDIGSEQALAAAERVRRAVEAFPFPHCETQPGGRVTISIGVAVYPHEASGPPELVQRADEALYKAKDSGRNRVILYSSGGEPPGPTGLDGEFDRVGVVIQSLMRLANLKDRFSYGHAERVSLYAGAVGEKLGLSAAELRRLKYAALVHDLGFAAIDPKVLEKTGPLTEEEMDLIRSHTVLGVSIIEPFGDLHDLIPLIGSHHEHWDGMGYPGGLRGEEIPLGGRILCVADTYDAMTRDRPYRRALTPAEAVRELHRGAGTHFDPHVVQVLLEMLSEIGQIPADVAATLEEG